jgi:hypothetical protein
LATTRSYNEIVADIGGDSIIHLTDEDALALLDRQARRYLRVSGEEFIRRRQAGDVDDWDAADVVMLSLLIPGVERDARTRPHDARTEAGQLVEPTSDEEFGPDDDLPPPIELTDERWWRYFDCAARDSLGLTGQEFIRRWKAGEIADPHDPSVIGLLLMMPEEWMQEIPPEFVERSAMPDACDDELIIISENASLTLLDRKTRHYLGMSADAFIRRWQAGEIEDNSIEIGLSFHIPDRFRLPIS